MTRLYSTVFLMRSEIGSTIRWWRRLWVLWSTINSRWWYW